MKLCEFETGLDHALTTSETQIAAGSFQSGEAAGNRADGGAVDVGDFAEIKDDKVFLALNKGVRFLLEATTIRASLDTALHLKDGDALFGGRFSYVENHEFVLPFREINRNDLTVTTKLLRPRREIVESGVCNRPRH